LGIYYPVLFFHCYNDRNSTLREIGYSRNSEFGYILRPEVIEGFFYLWRLTKNSMYRDWVWDAVQAIDKYCRVDGGFAGLQNVYHPEQGTTNVSSPSFWPDIQNPI
ncbi:hypothetical protein COOONC_05516, partial [Cooperia oncophora]